MGRAIDMENKIDSLENRLRLVEDALEEIIQTRVHHVDLTDDIKTDEQLTSPGKRKIKKVEKQKTVSA